MPKYVSMWTLTMSALSIKSPTVTVDVDSPTVFDTIYFSHDRIMGGLQKHKVMPQDTCTPLGKTFIFQLVKC